MFYATGGAAWANTEYSAQTMTVPPAFPSQSNTSFHTTNTGWVIGGGAEWMATTNILLRAGYLYYNINNGKRVRIRAICARPFAYGPCTKLQLVKLQRSGLPGCD